jgi:nucleoside-diphosphate-sugar epimerase
MEHQETALVLGANGGIGGEMARQLAAAGWLIRAMVRKLPPAGSTDGIDWVRGDAMVADDVLAAADGCALIVHAVNPPGYRNWAGQVLPMLHNTIAAAHAKGAMVVLPGTVYNYGPEAFPLAAENAPQRPLTTKGKLRVQMEAALEDWCRRGGRALIVRAGDYFGPRAGNTWFAAAFAKPGRAVTHIANPGRAGVGHQWAYLPDVAATMVALIARRDALPAFARYHMNGHWDGDGAAMARAVQQVAARHGRQPRIGAFPWWLLPLIAPFNETMRELREMRYLWRQPLRLDNSALLAVLGSEPHTPLEQAVECTLQGQGCITSVMQ